MTDRANLIALAKKKMGYRENNSFCSSCVFLERTTEIYDCGLNPAIHFATRDSMTCDHHKYKQPVQPKK